MAGSKIFDRAEDFRIVAGFVDYAFEERFMHEVPQGHLLQQALLDPSEVDRLDRDALHAAFSRLQQLVHQHMGLAAPLDRDGQDDRPTMPPPDATQARHRDQLPPPMPAEIRARIALLRVRVARMHEEASDAASRRDDLLGLHVHFNRFSAMMARIDAAMDVAPPRTRGEAAAFLDRMEKDLAMTEHLLRIDDSGELDAVADEVMTDLSMARGYHVEKGEEGRREARALERLGKEISEALISGRVFAVRFAVIEAHLRAQRLLEPFPAFPEQAPLPPSREEMPTLSGEEPEAKAEPLEKPERHPAPARSREGRQDDDATTVITQAIDECQRLLGIFGRDEVSGHIVQRYRQLQFIMATRFDEERVVELIWAIRSDLEVVDRIHRVRDRMGTDEEAFRVLVQEVRGESLAAAEKLERAGEEVAAMRAYGQRLVEGYGAFRSEAEPHFEPLRRLLLEVHVEAARVLIPYSKIAGTGQGGDSGGSPSPAGGGGERGAAIGGFAAGNPGASTAPAGGGRFQASARATLGILGAVPTFFASSAAFVRGPISLLA